MKLFALSDLHLAHSVDKPMSIFGEKWDGHTDLIAKNWKKKVSMQDLVILGGDISWAKSLEEALLDFKYLNALPGEKLILRGNHDYWWSSLKKMEDFCEKEGLHTLHFLRNNAFYFDKFLIGGTRGWLIPSDDEFTEQDQKIYAREILRMRLSLDEMQRIAKLREESVCPLFVMHYPPISSRGQKSDMSGLLTEEEIPLCIFGHIHHCVPYYLSSPALDGVRYVLTSADQLNFSPKLLGEDGQILISDDDCAADSIVL